MFQKGGLSVVLLVRSSPCSSFIPSTVWLDAACYNKRMENDYFWQFFHYLWQKANLKSIFFFLWLSMTSLQHILEVYRSLVAELTKASKPSESQGNPSIRFISSEEAVCNFNFQNEYISRRQLFSMWYNSRSDSRALSQMCVNTGYN